MIDTGIEAAGISAGADVVAAMFEDHDAAAAARDKLVASGIPGSVIRLVDRSPPPAEVGEEAPEGVWQRIKDAFTSHPHAHGYAEGVSRGHAMVFVRAGAQQEMAMEVLESLDPIDLMSRSESWAAQGWNGTYATIPSAVPAAAAEPQRPVPPMLFSEHPLDGHVRSTGLINDDAAGRGIGAPLTNPMGIPVTVTRRSTVQRYVADPDALPVDDI